jgi:hypothetical protein
VADARLRSIDTLSSRRIAARGKPSLKYVLCARPETLSATSPEKLGSVRAARGAKVVTLPPAPDADDLDGPRDRVEISPIVAASLCIKPSELLTTGQAAKVDALKSASPDFTAMRRLAMRFFEAKAFRNSIQGRPQPFIFGSHCAGSSDASTQFRTHVSISYI